MRFKSLAVFSFLLIYSFNSNAQSDSQLYAERMFDKISERILLIAPSKKDSLITTFRTYYEDFQIYKKKGHKMIGALALARDTEISRILTKAQFDEYKTLQEEMELADARKRRSKEYGRK